MNDDRYRSRLERIEAPDPPPGLTDAARDRAGAVAGRRRTRRSRTLVAVSLGAAVLVGAGFTPPGRAATDWIAGVAGIGEEPTREKFASIGDSSVVVGNGVDPGGVGYEVIMYRAKGRGPLPPRYGPAPDGLRTVRPPLAVRLRRGRPLKSFQVPRLRYGEAVCFILDWPSYEIGAAHGEVCAIYPGADGDPVDPVHGEVEYRGLSKRTPFAPARANPVWWGLTGSRVERVEVTYRDSDTPELKVPAHFVEVAGDLRRRLGFSEDFGVFVAFPPAPAESWALLTSRMEIETVAYDAAGVEVFRGSYPPPRLKPTIKEDALRAKNAAAADAELERLSRNQRRRPGRN